MRWLIPSFGAGKRPMKLKLLQYDRPALHGGEANSMMSSAGVLLTLSMRAIPPGPLVAVSAITGFGPNSGRGGGSRSGSRPQIARTVLILLKNFCPSSGRGFPSLGWLRTSQAPAHQATRCGSVILFHRREKVRMYLRTRRCAAVRGFLGETRLRRNWPERLRLATTAAPAPRCGPAGGFIEVR